MTKGDSVDIALFTIACKAVIRSAKQAKPDTFIHYAAAYAKLGLEEQPASERYEWIRSASQNILANLVGWRGEEARNTKAILRGLI